MSFSTCLLNRFKCNDLYESRREAISKVNSDAKKIEGDIKSLHHNISKLEKTNDNKLKLLIAYENYPKLWDNLPPIKEVGKPIDKKGIADIFKSSWGVDFVDGSYPNKSSRGSAWSNPDRNVEAHFDTEMYSWRIPMDIIKTIAKRSLVSEWTHTATWGHREGPYACNDFATSFYFEIKMAPLGYHQTCIAILGVTGHRINAFIPAEVDKVYYFEPQNDKMWFPDLDPKSKERKPSHLIF